VSCLPPGPRLPQTRGSSLWATRLRLSENLTRARHAVPVRAPPTPVLAGPAAGGARDEDVSAMVLPGLLVL